MPWRPGALECAGRGVEVSAPARSRAPWPGHCSPVTVAEPAMAAVAFAREVLRTPALQRAATKWPRRRRIAGRLGRLRPSYGRRYAHRTEGRPLAGPRPSRSESHSAALLQLGSSESAGRRKPRGVVLRPPSFALLSAKRRHLQTEPALAARFAGPIRRCSGAFSARGSTQPRVHAASQRGHSTGPAGPARRPAARRLGWPR